MQSLTRCPAGDACIAERGTCGHEKPDRAPLGVGDGRQFGVHATPLRGNLIPRIKFSPPTHSANQTSPSITGPLFSPPGWKPCPSRTCPACAAGQWVRLDPLMVSKKPIAGQRIGRIRCLTVDCKAINEKGASPSWVWRPRRPDPASFAQRRPCPPIASIGCRGSLPDHILWEHRTSASHCDL